MLATPRRPAAVISRLSCKLEQHIKSHPPLPRPAPPEPLLLACLAFFCVAVLMFFALSVFVVLAIAAVGHFFILGLVLKRRDSEAREQRT